MRPLPTLLRHIKSNAVAYAALFLALGGTSYAAIALPRNSVGTAQLKKGAVTAAKVKAHSLLGSDFKVGQLPAGARGETGPKGEPGTPGAAGSALAYARVLVTEAGASVEVGRSSNITSANVTHPAKGVTCFSGLPFTPHNIIATTDAVSAANAYAEAALAPDSKVLAICGAGAQAVVATVSPGEKNEDDSFYVVFN